MTDVDSPLALVLSGGGARGAYEVGVLRYVLGKLIPWRNLHQGVSDRRVLGVTVSATDVETGHTVVFIETEDESHRLVSSGDRAIDWTVVRLTPQHALASAAIPIIFPTVRVAGRIYSDGSLRQNTPIAPALKLGAGRVLVVGLRTPKPVSAPRAGRQDAEDQRAFSSPLYLFGKLLDALLLDRVENDLANLRRVNAALRALSPGVLEEQPVALALVAAGGSLRPVSDLFIRPSQDLGKIAADVLTRPAVRARLVGPAGYLMRRIGENAVETQDPSDLLSYLLFDGEYARELIALGERDAHEVREELDAFLAAA